MKNRSTIFTLGQRFKTIESELESSIIIPHASVKSEQKYSMESIFRSEQFALLDNACNECLFLYDFFLARDKVGQELFLTVFTKTFQLMLVSLIEHFIRFRLNSA